MKVFVAQLSDTWADMKLFLESTPGFSSVSMLGDNCCTSEVIIIDTTLHLDAF